MSLDEPMDDATGEERKHEVLFECDQCTNQEWRPAEQEPWLCAVCGCMRWSVIESQNPE